MRRLLAVALLALAVLPWASAQQAPPASEQAAANFVFYHAHPDPRAGAPDADPMSTPRAPGPDAPRLPLTRFDRVADADAAPEGAPESVPAHFREYQRLLRAREAAGASLALVVDGRLDVSTLRVEARADAAGGNVTLAATLVEDGVAHEGASGVRAHRFVARADLAPQEGARAAWNLTLDPSWDAARLLVVVHARDAEGEALQSARWSPAQPEPTVQTRKAVLVEHVTASWCVPCGPSDEALALLAAQTGEARLLGDGGAHAYARPLTPLALAGLALGLTGASWSWRRWRA